MQHFFACSQKENLPKIATNALGARGVRWRGCRLCKGSPQVTYPFTHTADRWAGRWRTRARRRLPLRLSSYKSPLVSPVSLWVALVVIVVVVVVSQLRSGGFGKVSCFTFSLWLSWFYLQLNKMPSTVLNANFQLLQLRAVAISEPALLLPSPPRLVSLISPT